LGCKLVRTPMNTDVNLWNEIEPLFEDDSQYRRLAGELIYLTVTRPDITYAIRLMSQFIYKPREIHWKAALEF